MIRIGLCDDNNLHIEQLTKILQSLSKNNNLEIDIITFNSGDDILEFCKNHQKYFDIFFLDILMKGTNGIEVAKLLREYAPNEHIVFVTSSKDYALDSYSVNAYDYILKPFAYNSIENILLSLSNLISLNKKNTIYVKNNQDIYSLDLNSVVYFESNLRKITAYLSTGEKVSFYNKMSNLENEINSNLFIRCHRSFLVNLIYLKNIISNDIITTTHVKIPISKKYLTSIRDSFTEFIRFKLSE